MSILTEWRIRILPEDIFAVGPYPLGSSKKVTIFQEGTEHKTSGLSDNTLAKTDAGAGR